MSRVVELTQELLDEINAEDVSEEPIEARLRAAGIEDQDELYEAISVEDGSGRTISMAADVPALVFAFGILVGREL